MKHKSALGRVLRGTVSTNRAMALLTGGIILFSVGCALLPPLVLERIVDGLAAGKPIAPGLALAYFGALALSGFLEAGENLMIVIFGQKVTHRLRSELCGKLKRLPAAYYTRHEPGKITSRFVSDVDAVDSLFTNGIIAMAADGCKVVSVLAVIFYKSTGVGVLMLLVTPLLLGLTRAFQKRMLRTQLANRAAVGKVNNHVPETIRNIRMIQTIFCQRYMERKYDGYMEESYRATERSNFYDAVYSPIVVCISACVIAGMMVGAAGGTQQMFGISVGTAVALIAYVGKVFEPLESIGMEIQNIQSAIAGVKRVNEFLEEPERSVPEGAQRNCQNAGPCVRFDHVDFGYEEGTAVLRDLSFSVERGENVTFAGRTGAGKSTVFRLLLGLYGPCAGRVLINSVDAAAIPDAQKRKLFGYVEQAFHPVLGTVADQITLFDPAIDREGTERAAKLVGLHEKILTLPEGYDTSMAQAAFSQGQLQLLSIARAIAAEPEILLLDEITANLDSETERKILDALESAGRGRTVLSISHRLPQRSGGRLIEIGF
ncbi:ABC transporter ATP-binding protein [Oscillibacter sp.]|uniref:ABC transporter ATP-binding protein n=1 Tax=Oscillibacter sp. TaxID=1945593 RepID=UPI00262803AF|nr:ABC transporter ATP-binding protein [Oscillibacter sp.]MDD3347810.1 ABC transporter ATP-binding protein [Oscillibacter sp.]